MYGFTFSNLMESFNVSRWDTDKVAHSNLDHLHDAFDIAEILTAREFVEKLLTAKHGKTSNQSKELSRRIASHAKLAGQYAKQVILSSPEISFLPAYYSILNLAKVCSLAGPYSHEFSRHTRWHGATYAANGKSSHTLLTEEVVVKKGGALALFYKTMTGDSIVSDHKFKLREVYPSIHGIGSELSLISADLSSEWIVQFSGERIGQKITIQAEVFRYAGGEKRSYKGNVRKIPALVGFKKMAGAQGIYISELSDSTNRSLRDIARGIIRTQFLGVRRPREHDICYIQKSSLPLTEEFAAAIAFFHLSSVCRYNPELIIKFSNSPIWPALLAMRRHTLCDCLLKCLSYMFQENYYLLNS